MNAEDSVISAIDELEHDEIDDLVDWQLTDSPAAKAQYRGGGGVDPDLCGLEQALQALVPAEFFQPGYEAQIWDEFVAGRVHIKVRDPEGRQVWRTVITQECLDYLARLPRV